MLHAQDIRLALRRLTKSPAFTLVAVVTLALGIGANSAVFSLVNRVLFRPLPVERSAELVSLNLATKRNLFPSHSYLNYKDLRDRNQGLAGLVAYRIAPMAMSRDGNNSRLWGYLATGNYFEVLGVRAILGRALTPADDQRPGAHPVMVLSYGSWQRQFGGDPGVVGKTAKLNGMDYTVLGVMPRAFTGTELFYSAEVWVPMMMASQIEPGSGWLERRSTQNIFVLGRLKPGVTSPQAEASLNAVAAELAREFPAINEGLQLRLSPPGLAGSFLRGPVLGFTGVLLGVTGLVLLIACTNLAGLLLARASDRRKEIALRLALGASRMRLVRQLLTESAVLSLAGGVAGLLLAWWLTSLIAAWRPPIDLPLDMSSTIDFRVVLFTCATALLTSLLFGLTPAFQSTRTDLVPALKGAAGSERLRRFALRDAVVALQVGLSVVLLTGSVLVVRSLQNAARVNIGFQPDGAAAVSFDLSLHGYTTEKGREFRRRLLERARALAGIDEAALADRLPIGLNMSKSGVLIEGKPVPKASEIPSVFYYNASPGYFHTMRTRLLAGREFESRDVSGARPVAIVNEAFVKQLLPGEEPLGKRFKFGRNGEWRDIVGVVETGKHFSLGEPAEAAAYEPMEQNYDSGMTLVARSRLAEADTLRLLRRVVLEMDPAISFFEAGTLNEHMRMPLLPARAAASSLGAFGVVALLLAATGVYGLMAYAVARRTREIGIRMALGARSAQVIRLVLGRTAALLGIGVLLGGGASLVTGQLFAAILYDVSPRDPVTLAAAVTLMAFTALVAGAIPARRAMAIDPSVSLREE